MTDEELLKKRLAELASRAAGQGRYTFSEFLTPAEQSALLGMGLKSNAPFRLEGGYPDAERRVAVFGSEELCGYEAQPPIACVHIRPRGAKFDKPVGHRDVLGALMGLGIRRGVLGDIVLRDGGAYVFCLEAIALFLAETLAEVGRVPVAAEVLEALPELEAAEPEEICVNVASERLDALVAAVWRLSRAESQELFYRQKVFVNGRAAENPSAAPQVGDIVSVRGFGRFLYRGVSGLSRKGRLFVTVGVYGKK
ncbi:MAG: hypothetical protein GX189_00030 [Clostridiales bacterium]|nr:hypothetical protein [Clostridiales bacterium]